MSDDQGGPAGEAGPARAEPEARDMATRTADARSRGQELRERMIDVAAAIAVTEDEVAATLRHLAQDRPHDAVRLQARCEEAERAAASERAYVRAHRPEPEPEPGASPGDTA